MASGFSCLIFGEFRALLAKVVEQSEVSVIDCPLFNHDFTIRPLLQSSPGSAHGGTGISAIKSVRVRLLASAEHERAPNTTEVQHAEALRKLAEHRGYQSVAHSLLCVH